MRARRLREVPELREAAAIGVRGPDSGGNWSVCCPFCLERVKRVDAEFKMTIRTAGELPARMPDRPEPIPLSLDHGVYNCYRCGARGFASFEWLAEAQAAAPAAPAAPEINLGPPEGFVSVKECERSVAMRWVPEYFASRGVLEAARAIGAGGVHRGKYQDRVVVPFVSRPGGAWEGFSARLVGATFTRQGDVRPKYLYPRGMDRRRALWGAAWLPADGGAAYIVEGVFDGLPLFPSGVATLGKSITPEQLDALVALGRPLIPCLDGDAWEACRNLSVLLRARGAEVPGWCHLPPESDPGTLGRAVAEYMIKPA